MTDRPPPHWLVIGAPKAGTTTLANWLAAHPQLLLADEKEVRYWNVHYDRGPDWYRQQFSRWRPGLLAGEATPSYMYSDRALDRIAAAVPQVRLVVVLREHVERLWSQHWYVRATGMDPRSLDRALRSEERGGGPWGAPVGYLESSRYAPRLRAVLERFDRGQLLVTFFDDLRADKDSFFGAICEHLGVTPMPVPADGAARNVGRPPRSAWVQWATWHRPMSWLPPAVKQRVRQRNLRSGGYPPIPPEVRNRLRERFADDRAELVDLLGRDLPPAWGS